MRYSDLIAHPEGGRYLEVYRSATQVQAAPAGQRAALTHIYFSLDPHEVSRFHRVLTGDEVWNLYQGAGVLLYQWDGVSQQVETIELSSRSLNFCHVVPAGYWQAAAPMGERVLVGCSVAPGFEYDDFELIEPDSAAARELLACDPSLVRLM
jgi:hypothetical protein